MAKLILVEQSDLVCVQETHLRAKEERFLREVYRGINYHASAPTKSRGAMLVISKMLAWTCNEVDIDYNGKYIIINGSSAQKGLTLVGIYASNVRLMEFRKHMKYKLS